MCSINLLFAPARMHTNTIIYPTGHKYETKQKYEICRLKKKLEDLLKLNAFIADRTRTELI